MLTTTNHLINGNHVDGAVETPRPTSGFGRAGCPSPPLRGFIR